MAFAVGVGLARFASGAQNAHPVAIGQTAVFPKFTLVARQAVGVDRAEAAAVTFVVVGDADAAFAVAIFQASLSSAVAADHGTLGEADVVVDSEGADLIGGAVVVSAAVIFADRADQKLQAIEVDALTKTA